MPRQKTKNKKRIKKKGGENKTYTKNEAIKKIKDDYDKFLKMLQDKYNIYVGSDLVKSSQRIQKNNLFKEMCKEEGVKPSDIDPSVNTFEELFDKYKFSKLTKLLFEAQYNPSRELESALEGGENTSPNRAARTIQSRFRGNKDRKVAKRKKEQKKEQKKVDDFRKLLNTNLGDTENVPDDVMRNIISTMRDTMRGRGKKKKSKKLTCKKSKSRSKRGG